MAPVVEFFKKGFEDPQGEQGVALNKLLSGVNQGATGAADLVKGKQQLPPSFIPGQVTSGRGLTTAPVQQVPNQQGLAAVLDQLSQQPTNLGISRG